MKRILNIEESLKISYENVSSDIGRSSTISNIQNEILVNESEGGGIKRSLTQPPLSEDRIAKLA
jgi:hypothetical protein